LLTGTDPAGGNGQYKYRWESSPDGVSSWIAATGINDVKTNYDPGVMNGDTTYFRRVVGSGGVGMDVCRSDSIEVVINVLPPIANNLIGAGDAELCQGELVGNLIGTPASGGDGQWNYQWEMAAGQDTPDTWIGFGGDEVSVTDTSPLDSEHDRWYRRIVFSGPGTGPAQVCKDTTEILGITVHSTITAVDIVPYDSVCLNDTKVLLGETALGEAGVTPIYTWKDLDTGSDLPGSNLEDFTTDTFTLPGNYHFMREVKIGACTDLSDSMTITVMQLPGGTLTDAPFRACEQETELAIDLNIDALQTYVLPWTVTLKNGVTGGIGPIPISGDGNLPVDLNILEPLVDSFQFNYELESISYQSVGGRYECFAPAVNMSGVVPIHVFRKPEPQILVDGIARDSFKICNSTVNLIGKSDNGVGTWTSPTFGDCLFQCRIRSG